MAHANQYRRPHSPQPSPTRREGEKRPSPLTEREKNDIARKRALVHELQPEIVPFIKELHELGMIDGWRAIQHVEVLERPQHEPA